MVLLCLLIVKDTLKDLSLFFLLTRCNNLPKMFSQWKFCKLVDKFSALKVEGVMKLQFWGVIIFEEDNWVRRASLDSKVAIGLWQNLLALLVVTKMQLSPQIEQFSMSRANLISENEIRSWTRKSLRDMFAVRKVIKEQGLS